MIDISQVEDRYKNPDSPEENYQYSPHEDGRWYLSYVDFDTRRSYFRKMIWVPFPRQEQVDIWIKEWDDAEDVKTVRCKAIDGCSVNPMDECPHGHPSWLMLFGVM